MQLPSYFFIPVTDEFLAQYAADLLNHFPVFNQASICSKGMSAGFSSWLIIATGIIPATTRNTYPRCTAIEPEPSVCT